MNNMNKWLTIWIINLNLRQGGLLVEDLGRGGVQIPVKTTGTCDFHADPVNFIHESMQVQVLDNRLQTPCAMPDPRHKCKYSMKI